MRKYFLFVVMSAVCIVLLPAFALAGKVEVYTVREEEMSPMELRKQALDDGFARAVAEEAQIVLGGALDNNRLEALRVYLVGHSKTYIQGYNILSSEDVEDGLMMTLDVRVNRRTLRDGLTRLGFFESAKASRSASVVWPEEITEEELTRLQSLMVMSGLERTEGVRPAFTLEYGPEGIYKGTLVLEDREWTSANSDMSVVWVELWSEYFSHFNDNAVEPKKQLLTISGWFTPDGVLEFDRVLKGWDYAVEDSRLVEMDIQPTGVGATWDMNILDSKRLAMLLNSFLPQRGLSFQMDRVSGQ